MSQGTQADGSAAGSAADEELVSRLETMDADGVDQAIVIASHGYLRPRGLEDTRDVNTSIARYRDRRPLRFPAAVGVVEPLYGDAGLGELDRIHDELGLVGVSFHTRFQGVSTNSRPVQVLIERMAELGLVPIVHAVAEVADESMFRILDLAAAFPDLPMLILDAFSSHEQSFNTLTVAERAPNLVFDTSLAYSFDIVERFVANFGAERLVFGTWEPKTGAVGSLWDVVRDRRLNHRPAVRGGVLADECAALLEAFFARQRLG